MFLLSSVSNKDRARFFGASGCFKTDDANIFSTCLFINLLNFQRR